MKNSPSPLARLAPLVCLLLGLADSGLAAPANDEASGKTFIDYFLPTPITGALAKTVWGAAAVGPRDPLNGLEDQSMSHWDYWDGKILKTPDGKYHLFGSRWDQAKGHSEWHNSRAIHAVSEALLGPYVDKGLCWPDNQGGKGHNVTALVLPDGRYAVVVSETRPGDVFVASTPDGPWEYLGAIKVVNNQFRNLGWMSNTSIMVRPDGRFEIVPRSGAILLSTTGVLGPYTVQGPSIYPQVAGLSLHNLEDPTIWYSGGLYHIVVNSWSERVAYHLTSVDGISDWKYRGVAYDPTKDFLRYTDGTVNHWNKMERPSVYLEDGHVTAVTLAVIDIPKEQENGNDGHGSKIVVIPFDGAGLDRDDQAAGTTSGANVPVPSPAADDPAKSSLETDPAGWVDIMPPADLAGWVRLPIKAGGKLGRAQWHVENGMVVCDGDGGHDMLLLNREIGNAIFHVEFCLAKLEQPKAYNSGVFVRTSLDGAIWHQAQVGSLTGGYWFGVTPAGAATKAFHVETKPCRVKEAGEWNTYEVTAQGPKLTLWVNGFVTAELPDCGLHRGYLGLEGEGYRIQFRNLKLKELP